MKKRNTVQKEAMRTELPILFDFIGSYQNQNDMASIGLKYFVVGFICNNENAFGRIVLIQRGRNQSYIHADEVLYLCDVWSSPSSLSGNGNISSSEAAVSIYFSSCACFLLHCLNAFGMICHQHDFK